MARRRPVTVTDPQVLKALAHPVRQHLLTLLTAGEVITASQVAEQVGMSPSAVSHHLRQLEKYGLARRALTAGPGAGSARSARSAPATSREVDHERPGARPRSRPSGADRRERPWESAVTDVSIDVAPGSGPAAMLAAETIMRRELSLLGERLERATRGSNADDGPTNTVALSRSDLWLTPDEAARLQQEIAGLLKPWQQRTSRRHPRGAAYRVFVYSLMPDKPAHG